MLRTNEFRKFFIYVLMDYCEDTCTSQDEIYNSILLEFDIDRLYEVFIDEGFMDWYPTTFECIGGADQDSIDNYDLVYELDDPRSLTCVEQFWNNTCRKADIDFSELIAIM